MGCRHSSSPPGSLKLHRVGSGGYRPKLIMPSVKKSAKIKSSISTKTSSPAQLAFQLEHILDGHGKNLLQRFELTSACLLFDMSSTHILLLDHRTLRLINMSTMKVDMDVLPMDNLDIQEIAWSTHLKAFLLLTTDRLYQTTSHDQLQLKPIEPIQFSTDGHRKSFMTINGDDLLINRSFGCDLRHYSLSTFRLVQPFRVYLERQGVCVTTIRLNTKKVLALAIAIGEQQMIDLIHLNTHQLIRRIQSASTENIFYPVDLHFNGLWFAKTSMPYVNIGHSLISSDGDLTRLKLFSHQDNFIRSLKVSDDRRWVLVGRQHALELYSLF